MMQGHANINFTEYSLVDTDYCVIIFAADKIYIVVFWGMTGCILLCDYWRFGGTYCLLQGRRWRRLFFFNPGMIRPHCVISKKTKIYIPFHYILYTRFSRGLYPSDVIRSLKTYSVKNYPNITRSLPLGKTRYPLYRRQGGPQGRSGQVRKMSPPPGFNPRTSRP